VDSLLGNAAFEDGANGGDQVFDLVRLGKETAPAAGE
jgi:hypothetical protein